MAGNENSKINSPQNGLNHTADSDLARLQNFLLESEPGIFSEIPPAVNDLSVDQLEALLAQKRREEARQVRRRVRSNRPAPEENIPVRKITSGSTGSSASIPGAVPALPAPPRQPVPDNPSLIDRFEPTNLVASKGRRRRENGSTGHTVRDVLGYTLEALVIVAVLVLCGNWALQQAGISINPFEAETVKDFTVLPSRPEGIFLSANAAGQINLPGMTGRNQPIPATATPASTPQSQPPRPTPVIGNSAPVAVAPTPTPAIVSPILQTVEQGAAPPPSPPRRLLIPRLGLDTPVREVTVNLGNWQVADNAAGHHLGTAMPGQPGNMVLAGHRDIRGSVFLKLNELQKGDEFRVVTDKAVFRYTVTDITEVAPTDVSVMAPTLDPTATLITCTPIGLATRRLIVKARLEK